MLITVNTNCTHLLSLGSTQKRTRSDDDEAGSLGDDGDAPPPPSKRARLGSEVHLEGEIGWEPNSPPTAGSLRLL